MKLNLELKYSLSTLPVATFSFLVAIVAAARTLQQATKLRPKAATRGRRGAAAGVGAHPLGG